MLKLIFVYSFFANPNGSFILNPYFPYTLTLAHISEILEKFKTLMTFMLPTELAVVKSKLESEGIDCRVLDENTVQAHNFLSQAIGGVRLQVAESNLERARKLLEESGLAEKEKNLNKVKLKRQSKTRNFKKE